MSVLRVSSLIKLYSDRGLSLLKDIIMHYARLGYVLSFRISINNIKKQDDMFALSFYRQTMTIYVSNCMNKTVLLIDLKVKVAWFFESINV